MRLIVAIAMALLIGSAVVTATTAADLRPVATPVNPVNGEVVSAANVKPVWKFAKGTATTAQFQLRNSSGQIILTTSDVRMYASHGEYQIPSGFLQRKRTYYWGVRVAGPDGQYGRWTWFQSFKTR